MIQLESVTEKLFAPFGTVLEFPADCKEQFYIVERESESPWRIAVLRFWNKTIKKIECHPSSKESFEPLKGATVLLVAEHATPLEYKAFFLDKPVCLKKGIWHQVLSITPEAQVKIVENAEVESEFYELPQEVFVCIEKKSN